MKKIILLLLPMALMLLSSCGGGNDDEFTVECTYLKARAGTNWKYEVVQGATVTTQTTEAISVTEVDNTEVIVINNQFGAQSQESYLTCDQGKIIQGAPSLQTTTGQTVDNVLLKLDLDLPVGESYLALSLSQDLSQDDFSIIAKNDYTGEVLEKDISMPVGGTTYNGVVKFRLTTISETIIDGQSQGAFETASTIYYIAPEVATIYSEVEVQGTTVYTLSLQEYNY